MPKTVVCFFWKFYYGLIADFVELKTKNRALLYKKSKNP